MRFALVIALTIFAAGPALADTIDFEQPSGTTDPSAAGSITTATNVVSFSAQSGSTTYSAYLAGYGSSPDTTAYNPNDARPGSESQFGDWFLTDEANGPSQSRDYVFEFLYDVSSLSWDFIDWRGDGGDTIPVEAVLSLYDGTTLLASQTYEFNTPGSDDPNFVFLSYSGVSFNRAVLHYDQDIGTGIDNLTFTNTVPEPGTIVLLGLGLAGAVAARRRRRAAVRGQGL